MNNYYERTTCRLCNSKNLQLVLPLAKSPLCDVYLKEIKEQEFYDLNLYLCKECNFVQINTIVNPEIIYRDYIYVTTSSSGLESHFKQYAYDVNQFFTSKTPSLTIDIGSNDGTLLNYFKQYGYNVLGIEPSVKTAEDAKKNGIQTISEFFDSTLAKNISADHGKAELITINNLFANIDDLEGFIQAIDILLADEGILVIESSYLPDMINNMVFDFIYHEHLSYFSLLPLIGFFQKLGLELVCLHEVATKGGSMRYYWARENSEWKKNLSVDKFITREQQLNIGVETFALFQKKIETIRQELHSFLDQSKGKTMVGYGASATSTTLISYLGLDKYLTYLVDDNPGKINTYSPGYHIPVYASEKLSIDKPDVILILAWRFREKIICKISPLDSTVVIPLPHFEILNHQINE